MAYLDCQSGFALDLSRLDDSHRKNWYLWLSQWLVANNGFRMLTYWNPTARCPGRGRRRRP